VLELTGGAANGDDAGAGGRVLRGQPVEAPAGGDREVPDEEGVLPDLEGAKHVEAQRRAHEPGRDQGLGRAHVAEVEQLVHRGGQLAVEHAQHHRTSGQRAPGWSRTASPVSMLTRSSLVNTATAVPRRG
jgi:hypothetical protein